MQRITLEVTQRYIGEEGHMRPGNIIGVTPQRARYLIEKNLAKVRVGPTETKTAPVESNVKKSSGARKGGRSTRTGSSSAPGKAAQSSALPEAPASQQSNASGLKDTAKRLLGFG